MASRRSACRIGLVRNAVTPSSRQRAASPVRSADDNIMIVAPANSGVRLMRSTSSNPPISGMWTSISTNGNGAPAAAACMRQPSAARPPSTVVGRISQRVSIPLRMRRLVALSSTTSTDTPHSSVSVAGLGAGFSADRRQRTVKWKVLPRSTSLSTHKRPPIISTSLREMVSPRPEPPNRRVVVLSACSNASKIACCFSGAIPMPVSRMLKCRCSSVSVCRSLSTETSTSPCSVNLMALPTRLISTCRSRCGSPTTTSGTSARTS